MRYLSALAIATALFQAIPASEMDFELASVRISQESGRRSIRISPTTLTMTNVSLRDCLSEAYGLKGYQVTGPSWIGDNRYSLAAESSRPVDAAQIKIMLQRLLVDRFGLELHREPRTLSAYVLSAGSRSRSQLKAVDTREGIEPTPRGMTFHGITMNEFVEQFLSGLPVFDRPVVNDTGLEGRFTFTLNVLGDEPRTTDLKNQVLAGGADMFVRALEGVGLSLIQKVITADTLVVDRGRPVPTDN
jgi:uncharacterized protein (TIGR03435 family)